MIRSAPHIRPPLPRPAAFGATRPAPSAWTLQRLVTAQRIACLRRDAPRRAH